MIRFLDNFGLKNLLPFIYLITLSIIIIDFGFIINSEIEKAILIFYIAFLIISILVILNRLLSKFRKNTSKILLFDIFNIIVTILCLYIQFFHSPTEYLISDWLRWAMLLHLIRGATSLHFNFKRSVLNPAQIFIVSFIAMILVGASLLLLPNAAVGNITYIDALFTSTSAVCVTGLIVVDTSSFFTQFGQTIILCLIQAGGLGILTFASYFSYFFKGGASYENQIVLSDISNSNKIGEVFTSLKRILIITILVEFIGAILIFINLNPTQFISFGDKVYFSIFHSISSFCNAGFSTLQNGMMEEEYVFNYGLQFTIIIIFILGGLGFPILINILRYVKHIITRYILFFLSEKDLYKPWILSLSNKINLCTNLLLLVAGTTVLYTKEYYNTLNSHSGLGKIVTALFTATTPRTAGYNSIDFSQLEFSSIIVIILLMWIGASPASTGGGIKTSTFAIATLNFFNLAKGKNKIEIWRREIADISVRRAFATMTLSLIVIGFGIFLIAHFDNKKNLLDIAFECFSAYSTVGLSLGITASLTVASKTVLIVIMFVGRVTMLSILIAIFKKAKALTYQYPTDEILIN